MTTSLPNPYGPATQIGAGLQSLANGVFSMGRYGAMGRMYRQRSEEQNAEDAANAEKLQADQRKVTAQAVAQEQVNAATSPESLEDYAVSVAGIPRNAFRLSSDLNMGHMPAGPIPEYGDITPAQQQAAAVGNLARTHLAANPDIDPVKIYQAIQQYQRNNDYLKAMSGEISADTLGNVNAAIEGKDRYGVADGTQYSKQVKGRYETTPVGAAKIKQSNAAAGASGAQAGKARAETQRINSGQFGPGVTIEQDGVPVSRFLGQVADKNLKTVADPKVFAPGKGDAADRVKPLSKSDYAVMNVHLADTVGTDFDNIDPKARSSILSRAENLATDPSSPRYRNPRGAIDAAVKEIAPEGFEGGGLFSKYRPRPGARTEAPKENKVHQPGKPAQGAVTSSLPDAAKAQLKEGEVTRFGNGQTWTMTNGVPVQVR